MQQCSSSTVSSGSVDKRPDPAKDTTALARIAWFKVHPHLFGDVSLLDLPARVMSLLRQLRFTRRYKLAKRNRKSHGVTLSARRSTQRGLYDLVGEAGFVRTESRLRLLAPVLIIRELPDGGLTRPRLSILMARASGSPQNTFASDKQTLDGRRNWGTRLLQLSVK